MMGEPSPNQKLYYQITVDQFVSDEHPFRKIRPLIDTGHIRKLCTPLYSQTGRPSIPPEQLMLALVAGYVMGITSERKIVMHLQSDMAFRWFVGLDIDAPVWDASTFSQNRRRRFDDSGVMEKLFDRVIRKAREHHLISSHVSVDGTLVRANASQKSFAPIEVKMSAAEYRKKLREDNDGEEDSGNPTVDFRGEKRSNATHRSTTDPDCRLARKSHTEGAVPAYTVNGVMENRNRFLLSVGPEIFRGPASEHDGTKKHLTRIKKKFRWKPTTLGGDKGYFAEAFIKDLCGRGIAPHIAAKEIGKTPWHVRVRKKAAQAGYQMSQRARKKIEELWGEAKEFHGFRRFRRRGLAKVTEESWFVGWILNLKRLAKLWKPPPAVATA